MAAPQPDRRGRQPVATQRLVVDDVCTKTALPWVRASTVAAAWQPSTWAERRDAAAVADDGKLPAYARLDQPRRRRRRRSRSTKVTSGFGDNRVEVRYACVVGPARRLSPGAGSSGSASVLTGQPAQRYRALAKLWATNLRDACCRPLATSRRTSYFGPQPVSEPEGLSSHGELHCRSGRCLLMIGRCSEARKSTVQARFYPGGRTDRLRPGPPPISGRRDKACGSYR